jgi:hypothetical protein
MTINQKNQNFQVALNYAKSGFSVIPVGQDKKPLIEWKKFQSEKASEEKIKKWFAKFPSANVGIITGKISGIVVVDIEAGGDIKNLPATVISKTGGGGWHFFYKHPGKNIKNAVRIRDKIDIRGDGGYVVAPPSTHKSGRRYEWSVSPETSDFAELPLWVLEKCSEDEQKKKTNWQELSNSKILEGSRNMTAAQIAGKLLYHLPVDLWELSGWTILKEWNLTHNKPPLDDQELKQTWESIKNSELQKMEKEKSENQQSPKKSQSTQLIEIIESDKRITFFHDETKNAFLTLPVKDHFEIWSCKNKRFKQWLGNIFWKAEGKVIYSEALNTTINAIEGKAIFDGQQHALHNRITWYNDAVWYDLSDENWRAVKITSENWEIVNKPPILFRRYSHQKPQIEPVPNGDIKTFLNFININDEKQKLLLLVYLVSCFIPDIPHPIPIVYGDQGSAKSTLSKLLRRLIDPSMIEVSECSQNAVELIQNLSHHWFIFFDNVSHLSGSVSDILCKAVTGSGFSKRALYSNDDDIIYTFKRCIGMNGINLIATKPDLLDRSILFELERITKEKRQSEKELFEKFEKELPRLLGDIFNIISKALQIKPNIKLDSLPRMADFTVWGCAIAQAMGHTQQEFLAAYNQNIESQNKEVIYGSFVASAVISFMDDRQEWNGTSSELLEHLKDVAEKQNVKTDKEKNFPKAANILSRQLNQLKTNLAEIGIQISRGEKNRQRIIYIRKISNNIVSTDEVTLTGDIREKIGNDNTDDNQRCQNQIPSRQVELNLANSSNHDDKNDNLPI